MQPSLKSATINWLVSQPSQTLVLNDQQPGFSRTSIPMPEDMGYGWLEIIPLTIGMYLSQVFYHFTDQMYGRMILFHHIQGVLSEPTLVISSARSGRVIHKDFCVGGDYSFGSGKTIFKLVDRIDHQPTFDASSDVEVTILAVGLSVLRIFLGDSQTDSMLGSLRLTKCPAAAVHVLPASISKQLHSTLQTQLTGSMRILSAQSKVLEYICNLAHSLNQRNSHSEQATTTKDDLITQLHDDLILLEGKIPTLDELAKSCGTSARLLNDGFKNKYGCSIFNYISELRLNAAHDALLVTKTPMKSIADNLGYSHVNHFISAFGKKFGYSPGSLRKMR